MIAAHLLNTEKIPRRFTCTTKLNLFISCAPSLPTVLDDAPTPAQLTLMCMGPKCVLTASTAVLTEPSSVTLTW